MKPTRRTLVVIGVMALAALTLIGYAVAQQGPFAGVRRPQGPRGGRVAQVPQARMHGGMMARAPQGRMPMRGGMIAQAGPGQGPVGAQPRRGAPGGMGGGMGPGMHRPPMGTQEAERMGAYLGLLGRMKHVCFEPDLAGVVAAGGLRDEVKRKPKELIEDLEAVLTKTKTLGLRNAIRMTLKDLYKGLGEDEKVLEHLRAMLAECDQALQKDKK